MSGEIYLVRVDHFVPHMLFQSYLKSIICIDFTQRHSQIIPDRVGPKKKLFLKELAFPSIRHLKDELSSCLHLAEARFGISDVVC